MATCESGVAIGTAKASIWTKRIRRAQSMAQYALCAVVAGVGTVVSVLFGGETLIEEIRSRIQPIQPPTSVFA